MSPATMAWTSGLHRAPSPGRAGAGLLPKSVDVLDYLFSSSASRPTGLTSPPRPLRSFSFFWRGTTKLTPELRVAAAERAASLNIIDGETLATVYRDAAPRLPKSAQSPAALRAKLFASLEAQTSEKIRAEFDRRSARERQGREDRNSDGASPGAIERADAIRKPQVSPRRTCAWRRLPATTKPPGT